MSDQFVGRGSQIAKSGFRNEDDIINKFNNWKSDKDAQEWLKIMKYDLNEIEYVKAIKISKEKTDVQVQITVKLKDAICAENIQVKLVSNKRGFNQIDKRWINKYKELWSIPDEIVIILKHYTGEELPFIANPKDPRRMFMNEFTDEIQNKLLDFFNTNKVLIISDIIKGRGCLAAEWMLVAWKLENETKWGLYPINQVINHFSQGDARITGRGNIILGKVTIQRKGGDSGMRTSQMLQFKINPADLFH